MGIRMRNATYFDEFGNAVSEEGHRKAFDRFNKFLNDKWEMHANEIVNATKNANNDPFFTSNEISLTALTPLE